ncbi:MAG TPA: tRNA lysidine(34) synthetase TilS, partial [Geobacteraceae bacterium]|nr:tRNA lysidine(34) synthetase TilS [Geobacteraceae bacterium]
MQLLRRNIARYIRDNRLFEPGATVIVALSGGADSVALLDILANLPGCPLTLVPAHLNHLLRGEESEGDEQFVRHTAQRYGLEPEIRRADVAAAAAVSGVSLEEAGREARYAFFRELARKKGASAVALAHHRDDQAETVLMRLLRGSAGSGLAAMGAKGEMGLFVRPLLAVSRGEIEAYLGKVGMTWREDSSNRDTRFLRNRIRHELLPLLRSYNPRIAENLCQTAAALARDEELLSAMTADAFNRCVAADGRSHVVDLHALDREHPALRPRLFRMAIAAAKGDLRRISSRHLVSVEKLATSTACPNGTLHLPGDILVVREYG